MCKNDKEKPEINHFIYRQNFPDMLSYNELLCLLREVFFLPGLKIGIDFGSTSFTVFVEGKGIVMCEPSVAVVDKYSGKTLAFGNEAKAMCEKLPESMSAVYPIKDGIVIDRRQAGLMLENCINKVCRGRLFKPDVMMCVPGTVTPLQKKTVYDVIMSAGAGRACFVDEALCAALGAGVSRSDKKGTMVLDIGGGVTNCSVVALGNIALSDTVNIGGNDFTKAIIEYIAKNYKVEIGASTAEDIKMTIGSAVPRNVDLGLIVCGKNTESGFPVQVEITAEEIYDVLKPKLDGILSLVFGVLENTSPELCGDIAENGIILTGGSANLYGIGSLLSRKTKVKAIVAENPGECAANGIGILLKEKKNFDSDTYAFRTEENAEEDGGEKTADEH